MSFWPQTLVDWAQVASAIGTCGAVIVSLQLANRRIHTKLETTCQVVGGTGAQRLKVIIRNVGRDAIYLVSIGGTAVDGTEHAERFMREQGFLAIPSGEPYTVELEKRLTITQPSEGAPKHWVHLWVQEVGGKRFFITGGTRCLADLWREMQN